MTSKNEVKLNEKKLPAKRGKRTSLKYTIKDNALEPDLERMKKEGANVRETLFGTTGSKSVEAAFFVSHILADGQNTDKIDFLNVSFGALEDMKPRDTAEGILLSNYINTSKLASNVLGKADRSNDITNLKEYVNLVDKTSRLMLRHLEVLTNYRTRGKQTISVKHQSVTVSDGGQAIVGNVGGGVSDEN